MVAECVLLLLSTDLMVKQIQLYSFFWVIPRHLDFICRRFGTFCSIFIDCASRKNNRDENLAQAIFEPNPFPYKYPKKLIPVILPAYTAYKDETDRVFRNVGI